VAREFYKVLIADDDYWTREKLCAMIDWSRYSLSCMTPAVDGEDVLRRLETEQPDILITDINMPFVNGVELLQIIHEKYPEIITFVISGYDDFQYVKDTFMAGSINYLLKPVRKMDLVNALSKALEIISERQADVAEREKQQMEVLKAASLLQDREFSQLLEREVSSFPPMIAANNSGEFSGISLMLIKIHDMGQLTRKYQHDMNLLSYSVKKEIRKYMKNGELFVFHHIYRPNEFAVITELDNLELTKKARYLTAQLKNLFQSPLTVMLSGHTYSMDSIHEAYIHNIAMLMTRVYAPEDALLIAAGERSVSKGQKISNRCSNEQAKELKILIRQKNRGATRKMILQKIGLTDCTREKWEYLEVKQTVKSVLNTFAEVMNEDMQPAEITVLENMINMSDKVIERLDVESVCDFMNDVIDFSLSLRQQTASHTVSEIIRQAAAYIDQHYFEDLNLSSLAKQFGVENSYFSRTFRQEMGENLMLYIAGKRMEKAGELIISSDIGLTEIAFMVGYDDYAYFNRVFRKHHGKSPREYRSQ